MTQPPTNLALQTFNADILGQRARVSPDHLALVDLESGSRLTYKQMNERALRCAGALTDSLRLQKGDRVAILSANRLEFLDLFAAIAKTGCVLVALNTRYTANELRFILADAGAKTLFYDKSCSETVAQLEKESSLESFVAFDEPLAPQHASYRQLCATSAQASPQPTVCSPEDLCCLLYTSGTTGKPKGVMIPHRMVAFNGCNTAVCWQFRETDVSPVFTPLYHAGGLFAFLVPIWTAGGTIVLHREFHAGQIWETIERERVTLVLGVPTIFQMLLDSPQFPAVKPASVRWFVSGGAPLPVALVEAYKQRGILMKQGFGMTEVGVNCFMMSDEEAGRKTGSIGKPMLFTQGKIVQSNGQPAPPGEVGELLLRGPHVCSGYWNNEQATREAIDGQGWFHTGDLARQDDEGFYYIAGRSKDMFISGGVNIYPAEIEHELMTHPEVKEAAVIGVPDPMWGEVGCAFVVPRNPGDPPSDLGAYLAARLAKYKVPKMFQFVHELPRTPYGKVVKHVLRSRLDQSFK
jgi:fatty-acyl-CoA synthase